jgi:putative zinc finger/helix-turn-helix YgiT family protein
MEGSIMNKKCATCREGEMQLERGQTHPYKECGLPNVVLMGVDIRRCTFCNAVEVLLPRVTELHRVIAMAVIRKPARLSGAEVRFLRKYLGWGADDFAKYIAVDVATISRWENEKEPIGTSSDRVLRLLVARRSPVEEYPDDILKEITDRRDPPLAVKARRRDHGWLAEAAL